MTSHVRKIAYFSSLLLVLLFGRNEIFQQNDEGWKIINNDFPDNILINIHVVMNNSMACTNYTVPGYFGMSVLELWGYLIGRFTDNLDKMCESHLKDIVFVKRPSIFSMNSVYCFSAHLEHMLNIDPIIFVHKRLWHLFQRVHEYGDAGILV